ncbi:unnamed protein product, partial [Lymnaea stagnalis]
HDELSIITQVSSNFPLNTFSSPQPEKKSTTAKYQSSRSYSHSDSDDSLTFVTDAVSSNSLGNLTMLSPISSTAGGTSQTAASTHHSPATSPDHVRHLQSSNATSPDHIRHLQSSTASSHQQFIRTPPG